ncbi:helix-turn-helix transcriptional regulator [Leptolyngbya sp. AN10]
MSEQVWADYEEELISQAQYPDLEDQHDLLMPQPAWLAQGYVREIALRDGITIKVDHYKMRDRWEQANPEGEEAVRFHCHLSGDHLDARTEVGNLEYSLYGSGITPKQTMICSGQFPIVEVTIEMEPEVLTAFVGRQGELPSEFQHLIGSTSQPSYARVGSLSPTMQRVLWQILRCPYQGMTKRMYLESKALEVAALMLEQEREAQQGRRLTIALKPDEVDRIHLAREILLRNLEQPPSLMELARQVGLNDNSLKRGFKQVFGQPVFAYLLDYRMEQAQQLLMAGELKVGEVMQRVGFRSRKYFAEAFRKRFGVNPKDYLNPKNSR